MLGEAGLAAHDARPRPRQTEARRRHPAGGHPGAGQGSRRHGPHPDREAVPGRVRMRLAHAARMALAQPAYGAHDPRWPAHCRITGCQVVRAYDAARQPEPQDRRAAPEGADLRRRRRCLSRGDRVRVGRRRWGLRPAASGPAAGAQAGFLAVLRLIIRLARRAITLRSMTRIGGHRRRYSARFFPPHFDCAPLQIRTCGEFSAPARDSAPARGTVQRPARRDRAPSRPPAEPHRRARALC